MGRKNQGNGWTTKNRDDKVTVEESVHIPKDLHRRLKYLGQADGVSVAAVIIKMIDNGVRHRRAVDPDFREHMERSA